MDTLIGVIVLVIWIGGFVLISSTITSARTRARVRANATTRTSLDVLSHRSAEEVGTLMAKSLVDAGLQEAGSFDGTRFFRLDPVTQLELKVWHGEDGTHARVTVPRVRSTSGRPQKLGAVGSVLTAAAQSVRRLDPQASIH
jgi:hypothetical protein